MLGIVASVAPNTAARLRRRYVYDDLSPYDLLIRIDHPAFIWMNWGLDGDDFSWLSEEDQVWKYQVNMARNNVHGVDLEGKRFLDTGSGRGGNCYYVHRYHRVSRNVGLDLKRAQVQWCTERFRGTGIEFVAGDAQALPFEDGSFDVVSNIESACHYPDKKQFFREVSRVLSPAGFFCHSCNYMDSDQKERMMRAAGLVVVQKQDITDRVAAALRKNANNLQDLLVGIAGSAETKDTALRLCELLSIRVPESFSEEHRYHSWTLQKA
jgi:O-methyltransferase